MQQGETFNGVAARDCQWKFCVRQRRRRRSAGDNDSGDWDGTFQKCLQDDNREDTLGAKKHDARIMVFTCWVSYHDLLGATMFLIARAHDPNDTCPMNPIDYASPEDAESAFYDAFMRSDLSAMMNVWADEERIICIHPMGVRLQGREEVEESWRKIFEGGNTLRFSISAAVYLRDENLSMHSVHENIGFGVDFQQRSLVLVTNAYRLTDRGWRMVLHHGSPSAVSTGPTAAERSNLH